jgi:hypothetical protein
MNGIVVIGGLQDNILGNLLGTRTLTKLLDGEAVLGNSAYQITELLSDLKKGIWSELATRKPIDIYRRNLQKSYVNILNSLLNPGAGPSISFSGITISASTASDKSDIKSVIRAHLGSLRTEINAVVPVITDPMTKYHLQDELKRIDKALNPKD